VIVAYTALPHEASGSTRPIVDIRVGDMTELRVPCLVDSGAIHTLLPRWVSDAGALDLDDSEVQLAVGGSTTSASFAVTHLAVPGLDFSWDAAVGFCDPWPYAWGLLGQHSFFRYFSVTFRAADGELEIEPVGG
jgi:hypothetical protein